ncbi:MAG: HNH endonuclease [Caldilinea sp.]
MTAKRGVSAAVRTLVRERTRDCCEYCQSQARFSNSPFVVEHIMPQALGGATILENLAYACAGCNGHKATKTSAPDPQTGEVAALFHPRRQQWHEHFRWDESFTIIEGSTPEGRATVLALHLNRTSLVNLRSVLRRSGDHPPRTSTHSPAKAID